jgi:uncharacterized protein (UPF0548 family)
VRNREAMRLPLGAYLLHIRGGGVKRFMIGRTDGDRRVVADVTAASGPARWTAEFGPEFWRTVARAENVQAPGQAGTIQPPDDWFKPAP